MSTNSASFLTSVYQLLDQHFDREGIQALCIELDAACENGPGAGKQLLIQELLRDLGNNGRLPQLITLAQQQRPNVTWPLLPDNFQQPTSDTIQGDKVSGDKLTVGDVSGSVVAVGAGARAEINHYTEIIVKLDSIEDVPPAPGTPPYKGLAYFTEKDADIYYGRENLSQHITTRISQLHFLALIGASGSGKSSLFRAGIIPRLRSQNWLIHLITPGTHPLDALANSLGRDQESLDFVPNLSQSMRQNPQTLSLIGDKLASRAEAPRLLLAIDQFEELFTQCHDHNERRIFVENLLTAANKQGAVTIMISLRADFYDRNAQFEGLRELVSQQQEFIGPMKQEELVRVIAEPAKRGGWQFVEGLVEQILEDAGQEPGRLPLLSHALRETWERRRGTVMTLAGYRAAGGVEGAIAQTAEMTLSRFDAQQNATAQSIFLSLTELGEGSEDTRRIASLRELQETNSDQPLDNVLQTLVNARLITTGNGQVEVAHEALIRRWPRLRNWLADNRERLRFERQLAQDAQQWQELGRDSGALYRGARLQQAIEWSEKNEIELTNLSARFLETSRNEAERKERELEAQRQRELQMTQDLADTQTQAAKRLRLAVWALGGVVVAMFIVIGILITPFIQEIWARSAAQGQMAFIPEGTFLFGRSETDDIFHAALGENMQTWPLQEVTLNEFWIDKYEVTNYQYNLCVNYSDSCMPPVENADWLFEKPDHPVVNVTILQANAFCQWLGKRLPTEAEWERAARGSNRGSKNNWPWGDNDPSPELINSPLGTTSNPSGSTEPVTERVTGVSPEGVFNLVGNVWEWTSSFWQPESTVYDHHAHWDGQLQTYQEDLVFVLRGGGWRYGIPHIAAGVPYRGALQDNELGIRCVSDKKP